MKILHVAHGYLPESAGGVEFYLRDLMAAQRDAGHEVAVLAGSLQIWERAAVEESEVEGVPVFRVHRKDSFFDHYAHSYNLDAEEMIVEVISQVEPDIVHVHHWIRLTANIVELAEAQGIPAIVSLHDTHTSCPRTFRVHRDGNPCFRKLAVENCAPCVPRFGHESESEVAAGVQLYADQLRSELARAHRVLVALPTTADLLSETTDTPPDLYHVVGLAYQRRFGNLTPATSPLAGESVPFRLGCWGNQNLQKGSHVLVEAFRKAVERRSASLELHLFGFVSDEAFAENLHQSASGLPVRFHGPYDAQQLVNAHLDAAVFPVLCFETFSLALTECFELKLPSIVTDIGALPARAGRAALVVPPGDASALAEAILDLATHADLRERLRAEIPPLPPEPKDHARTVLKIYKEACSTPAGTQGSPPRERWLRFLEDQRAAAQAAGRGPRDPRPPV